MSGQSDILESPCEGLGKWLRGRVYEEGPLAEKLPPSD